MIRIRYKGRRSHLPLSLLHRLPRFHNYCTTINCLMQEILSFPFRAVTELLPVVPPLFEYLPAELPMVAHLPKGLPQFPFLRKSFVA